MRNDLPKPALAAGGIALVLLPVATYLNAQRQQIRLRETAVARSRVDLAAWRDYQADHVAAQEGFALGQSFPALPLLQAGAQQAILGSGEPAIVVLVHSFNVDCARNDLRILRDWVEQRKGFRLLLVTEEPPQRVNESGTLLSHPRIRYASVQKGYLERSGLLGQLTLYQVDRSGAIRDRRVLGPETRLGRLCEEMAEWL